MEGESSHALKIPETIHSGDEEFVIEINSDYSDEETDDDNEKRNEWEMGHYDETDSVEQCTDQKHLTNENQRDLQSTKTAKVASPLKIGRDLDGKVNFIGLESSDSELNSDHMENDMPSGLENIKIINVCTLANDFEQDTLGNPRMESSNSEQYMNTEGDLQDPDMPSRSSNMIIINEQHSQSTLSMMLVCKFCHQLFPTHEALHCHTKQHIENKDEHSVEKHFFQKVPDEELQKINVKEGDKEGDRSHQGNKYTAKKRKSTENDSGERKSMRTKKKERRGLVDEENKCEKCGKIFMKDYQYKSHTSFCKGKITQMATCFECNKMIPAHKEYEHALKYHDIVCPICGVNQMKESKLRNHMKFMHKIFNYGKDTQKSDIQNQICVVEQVYYKTCHSCGKVCGSYEEFKEHRKEHKTMKQIETAATTEKTKEEENKTQKDPEGTASVKPKKETPNQSSTVKCENCDKEFSSLYQLESHLKRCSAKAVKVTLCDVCELLVPYDEHKAHVKSHEIICDMCGKVCLGEKRFKWHTIHCPAKQNMAKVVKEESVMKTETERPQKTFSNKNNWQIKKTWRSIQLTRNLKRKLTQKQKLFLEKEMGIDPKTWDESNVVSSELLDEMIKRGIQQQNSESDKHDKAVETAAVNEERENSPISSKLVSENCEEDEVIAKFDRDAHQDKASSEDLSNSKNDGSPGKYDSQIPLAAGSVECKTRKNGRRILGRRNLLGRSRRRKMERKRKTDQKQEDIVSLTLAVVERKCEEVHANISGAADTPFQDSVENSRNTLWIEPASSSQFMAPKISQDRTEAESDFDEEILMESSEKHKIPTSEPIVNSAILNFNGMEKSCLDDWLTQTLSSDNAQIWICRHCGKQLSTREEGFHHMIRCHPTNKTTKEIVKEMKMIRWKMLSRSETDAVRE